MIAAMLPPEGRRWKAELYSSGRLALVLAVHQGVRMIPISSRRPVGLVVLAASVALPRHHSPRPKRQLPLLRDNALVYAHHHLNATSIAGRQEVLGGRARWHAGQGWPAGDGEVPERHHRLHAAGADRRLEGHDGESRRLLRAERQGDGRQGSRRRLSDHHPGRGPGHRPGERRRRVHRGDEGLGRVHDGPRQREGRVRRESRPDDPDRQSSRALRDRQDRGDEGVVREDLQRQAWHARHVSGGRPARREPDVRRRRPSRSSARADVRSITSASR